MASLERTGAGTFTPSREALCRRSVAGSRLIPYFWNTTLDNTSTEVGNKSDMRTAQFLNVRGFDQSEFTCPGPDGGPPLRVEERDNIRLAAQFLNVRGVEQSEFTYPGPEGGPHLRIAVRGNSRSVFGVNEQWKYRVFQSSKDIIR